MTAFPSQFFLYFPFRHSQADPHSGFVLVDAVKEGTAWRITPRAATTDTYTVTGLDGASPTGHFTQNIHHEATAGLILLKTFLFYDMIKIMDPQGARVPVYEITKHTTVFTSRLKRNVQFPLPPPPPPAAPKPIAATLSPHVARQLLELARLKREVCPIIMEDLMEGHTAAMPCGHLFSRLAIEESFKKEPGRCPACRQTGAPTLV